MKPHVFPLNTWLVFLSFSWIAASASPKAKDTISLAGSWSLALDREDVGVAEQWFKRDLPERLELPGSLQAQGFGDLPSVDTKWMGDLSDRTFFTLDRYAPYRKPANFKFPYWLTPTRYYSGAAWYQRGLDISESWRGKRIVLHLERPHWGTSVWLDGRHLGSNSSLATPHEYDLTAAAVPGRHRLTVRVDNRYLIPVGVNSHSVSDHTQGNWNGLAGELKLKATAPVWINDLQVHPKLETKSVLVRGRIGNMTQTTGRGWINLELLSLGVRGRDRPVGSDSSPARRSLEVTWDATGATFETEIPLGEAARSWDEFHPALYRLVAALASGGNTDRGAALDTREVVFGLREVSVQGTQIAVNGRPIFLRGTLECCIFPLTGYPPTDIEAWMRILRMARAHGLNHLRFHSWTPPRAAFEAADALGFYLYVECPTWANGDSSVGDGREVDQWVYAEGDRILKEYGNHPSFIMMSYGNEPGGKNQKRWLGDLVRHWQASDRRRLYTSGAGWPMIPENDFHIAPNARGFPVNATLGETAGDYRAFQAQQNAPLVSHEIGQYCVFPNLDEIAKYQGWLKAKNFEIVRDFLAETRMTSQARDFLRASGRLQALFYKDEIEACLRTPGWAGFQLLDLHDFPGQGTALVGVLDPFWGEKGYIRPEEYRRFCDDTVPLARLPKRIWAGDETLRAVIDVAHFGGQDLRHAEATWRVRDGAGRPVARGKLAPKTLPTGQVTSLGEVVLPLALFTRSAALNLEVAVAKTRFANDWNFWVYPATPEVSAPAGVRVATKFDEDVVHALEAGARVVLFAEPRTVQGRTVGRFDPIFWNRMWFPTQPQHTLGLLIDPKHPALAGFPTAFHSDWQWQDLHNHSKPMIMNDLPLELRPIVQVIDDWNTCRKLGLLFEAKVGQGRLLVCSVDLQTDLARRPAARQFRRSLLDFAASSRFQPKSRLEVRQVKTLFRDLTAMDNLGAKIIRADSEQPGYGAANILDGDPATIWHTRWGDDASDWPHEVVIGFERPAPLSGLALLPRQDGNRNGWIKSYAIYVSPDGQAWGEPVAQGTLDADMAEKEIRFAQPTSGGFLKLVAQSGFDRQPFSSLAELKFLVATPK